MKNNSKKIKIIVALSLILIAVVVLAFIVGNKSANTKKDNGVTAVITAVTPTVTETESDDGNTAEENAIEYDISGIKTEDIETASAVKLKIDSNRNLTLYLEDGSEIEAGNIGGEKIKGTITVAFVDYDNRVIKAEMVEKGKSATPPANPVRTGYDFVGWSGNYSNPTKDTVVSAAYVKKDLYYTVTFRDYDGRDIRIEKVAAGSTAVGPTTEPTRDGYVFAGWDYALNDIHSDITATAVYITDDEPVIQVISASAKPGDKNVAVTISLKNNPGICSLRLNTEFSSGLSLSKFEFSKEMGGTSVGPQSVPVTGSATFLWYKYDGNLNEDSDVVTLYFDVSNAAKGKQDIRVSYDPDDMFNLDGENVTFGVMNGSIEVTELQ